MINKFLHARSTILISFYSMIIISIHNSNLFSERDFLFESFDLDIFLYAHAIDVFTNFIIAKNEFSNIIKISRNARLEQITKIQYLNVFHVDANANHIKKYVERKSAKHHKTLWFIRVLKVAVIVYTAAATIFFSTLDTVLSNDVTIHESNFIAISIFTQIVNIYFNLWKSEEFVKLFEK